MKETFAILGIVLFGFLIGVFATIHQIPQRRGEDMILYQEYYWQKIPGNAEKLVYEQHPTAPCPLSGGMSMCYQVPVQ